MAATATDHEHPHHPETAIPQHAVDVAPVRLYSLIAAVAGFGVYLVAGFINSGTAGNEDGTREFILAYACGFVFWSSLPFGSLALMMIGYVTGASWGVVLRRIFQASVRTLPVLFVLGLPLIASLYVGHGKDSPYWWANDEWLHATESQKAGTKDFDEKVAKMVTRDPDGDEAITREQAEVAVAQGMRPEAVKENQHKIHDYLSVHTGSALGIPGRYIVYFGILGLIGFMILGWAKSFEAKDDEPSKRKLVGLSAPGIIVWALLMTFFATDWVMSIEPTWASSMFPIVFGMNQFLTTFAFSTFLFYSLTKGKADILAVVKDKFRIDIGSLMLGFTMVWSYASFCQYMLIWAGNLPEEIPYYIKRGGGTEPNGWLYLAYFLMLFHWLTPFIVLLFREIKLNPKAMQFMTVLLLVVCASDVVWWLVPAVPHEHGKLHVVMAFAAIIGVGGLWGLAFSRELSKAPILVNNSEGKFLATWGHH